LADGCTAAEALREKRCSRRTTLPEGTINVGTLQRHHIRARFQRPGTAESPADFRSALRLTFLCLPADFRMLYHLHPDRPMLSTTIADSVPFKRHMTCADGFS